MNPGTLVGIMKSLTHGPKLSKGDELRQVITVNEHLRTDTVLDLAVTYAAKQRSTLEKLNPTFSKSIRGLANRYPEYKQLCIFAERFCNDVPPEGIEVTEGEDGHKRVTIVPGTELTRLHTDFLEAMNIGCGNPNCKADHSGEPFIFKAMCHPMVPPGLSTNNGFLVISCLICGVEIAKVKIAS